MSESGEPPAGAARCLLCGRPTYDPDKRERPWVRGVSGGRQALVCPSCQGSNPAWAERFDRCERCGSTRLSLTLGETTCRGCGHVQGVSDGTDPGVEGLLGPA